MYSRALFFVFRKFIFQYEIFFTKKKKYEKKITKKHDMNSITFDRRCYYYFPVFFHTQIVDCILCACVCVYVRVIKCKLIYKYIHTYVRIHIEIHAFSLFITLTVMHTFAKRQVKRHTINLKIIFYTYLRTHLQCCFRYNYKQT